MSIYGKPVWQLLIDFAQEHLDLEGSTFTPQDATRWFVHFTNDEVSQLIDELNGVKSANLKSEKMFVR